MDQFCICLCYHVAPNLCELELDDCDRENGYCIDKGAERLLHASVKRVTLLWMVHQLVGIAKVKRLPRMFFFLKDRS